MNSPHPLTTIAMRAAGALFTLAGSAIPTAHAQCGPQWLAPLPPVGVEGTTHAVCSWDPDGPGPLNPWLVVGGFIEAAGGMEANNVAAWDGVRWHSLNSVYGPTAPDGTKGLITALTSFDPDGDGPESTWLIAAGGIDRTIEPTTWGFHRWMGDHWELLRSGIAPIDRGSLLQFDPDGDGPMPTQLVLVGIDQIQTFDGANWTQIPVLNAPGLGADAIPLSVTAWDPDGSGPLPRQIVGAFLITSTWPDSRQLARWDGNRWIGIDAPLPQTSIQTPIHLGAWDPDARGPRSEQLYLAIDTFQTSLLWFDGVQWQPMTAERVGGESPMLFSPFDFDGAGPLPERLLITGVTSSAFGQAAAVWDGSTLAPLALDGEPYHPYARDVCIWDRDGDGEALPEVVVTTYGRVMPTLPNMQSNGLAIYDGHAWDPIGPGLSASIYGSRGSAIINWENCGRSMLVACGFFRRASGEPLDGIGAFDGAHWEALPPLPNPPSSLATWDHDSDESTPPVLTSLSRAANNSYTVRALDGDQWQSVGNEIAALSTGYTSLASFGSELVLVQGDNAVEITRINRWIGNEWSFADGTIVGGGVLSHSWFRRNESDEHPLLVLGGTFTGTDSFHSRCVLAWDGEHFIPIGDGLRSTTGEDWGGGPWVGDLEVIDFDGDGPQPARLIATGGFDRAGTGDQVFQGIAILNGDHWEPIEVPDGWRRGVAVTQSVWDPDGPGPILPKLRIFGSLNTFSDPQVNAWEYDGQTLVRLNDGANGYPAFVLQWDPDGPGPIPPRIQVAGSAFSIDYPERGSVFEAFLDDATPWVATPPRDVSGFESDTITITASIANGYAELDGGVQFQWRRDNTPIQDGPAGASTNGGIVAGASGTLHLSIPLSLTITNASTTDSGDYDLVVTNSCGTLASATAHVEVSPFCAADIDASGTIDANDLAAFFTAYETGAPNADVDRNGGVDASDIATFFAAYEGGC